MGLSPSNENPSGGTGEHYLRSYKIKNHYLFFNLTFTYLTNNFLSEEMITKIQEEMKQKSCGDGVKIEQVSFSAQFGGIQELAMVLEVSDLSSKKPLQWVEVAGGSSSVFLSGLPPDTLLQLTLKTMQSR